MADKKTWKEIAARLARSLHKADQLSPEVQKAIDDEIGNFENVIADIWQPGEMHTNPTREEIPSGSPQAASGAGATRMVAEYSHPARQHGVVEQYAAFSRMLGSMKSEMDAVKSVIHDLLKANEPAAPREGNELIEKAKQLVKKAKMLIVKAEMSGDDDDEDEDVGDDIEKAVRQLKNAKIALLKAQEDEEEDDERDAEVEKALETVRTLRRRLTKASEDYRIRIEKAASVKAAAKAAAEKSVRDADEAAAKAVAEAAAKAAKADDKGNQAAKTDEATGNQVDEAAKAEAAKAEAAKSEAAKANVGDQIQMLTKTVNQFLTTILGQDKGQAKIATPPDFAKATQAIDSIREAIDNGLDDGALSSSEALAAKSIVARIEAVRAGGLDRSVVTDQIAKSSANVQGIFSRMAA